MSTWVPSTQPPSRPGFYWTRKVGRITNGENGRRTIYYSQAWVKWDGEQWGGELDDWYQEVSG